ncbi:MAG: TonB-dependent receptor, partial [Candidatus Acidoferrum typicum]|nr:TonB-dependent receptor [Candidatus Acidoferrum typicum]
MIMQFQTFESSAKRCLVVTVTLLVGILFGSAACAMAQSTNAQVSGVVTDSSGGSVVDAEVAAKNLATGVISASSTNGAGVYVVPELLPGPYEITVTRQGFGPVTRSGVVLRTGDHLSFNFTLKPGAVEQSITVTGGAPIISMDQSSTSQVLDNKMITELPQLNRNTLGLTAVTPAVQGKGPLSDNIASLGNATYLDQSSSALAASNAAV